MGDGDSDSLPPSTPVVLPMLSSSQGEAEVRAERLPDFVFRYLMGQSLMDEATKAGNEQHAVEFCSSQIVEIEQ